MSARPTSVLVTRVVSDPEILGGQLILTGTRIPALTVLEYLRHGHSAAEIKADYPSIPDDGMEAVEQWALQTFGKDWKPAQVLELDVIRATVRPLSAPEMP